MFFGILQVRGQRVQTAYFFGNICNKVFCSYPFASPKVQRWTLEKHVPQSQAAAASQRRARNPVNKFFVSGTCRAALPLLLFFGEPEITRKHSASAKNRSRVSMAFTHVHVKSAQRGNRDIEIETFLRRARTACHAVGKLCSCMQRPLTCWCNRSIMNMKTANAAENNDTCEMYRVLYSNEEREHERRTQEHET